MTFLSTEHPSRDGVTPRARGVATQAHPITGLPHLVESVTPAQAETADLLALAGALEDAGLTPLLLRRASGRPALAVAKRNIKRLKLMNRVTAIGLDAKKPAPSFVGTLDALYAIRRM